MNKVVANRREARRQLDDIWTDPNNISVIHYSCEGFYENLESSGGSSRIASIAIRNLKTDQTRTFSIHKFAELKGYKGCDIKAHYKELEKETLDAFYDFIKRHNAHKWVHWSMRDDKYGFLAIESRYEILKGEPVAIQDDRKFDLERLVRAIYTKKYAQRGENGRLYSLALMNDLTRRRDGHGDYKTGKEEADLFKKNDFRALHQSTLAKVEALAEICKLAYENQLETSATFWDLHCSSINAFMAWVSNHPYISFISFLVTLSSVVLTVLAYTFF